MHLLMVFGHLLLMPAHAFSPGAVGRPTGPPPAPRVTRGSSSSSSSSKMPKPPQRPPPGSASASARPRALRSSSQTLSGSPAAAGSAPSSLYGPAPAYLMKRASKRAASRWRDPPTVVPSPSATAGMSSRNLKALHVGRSPWSEGGCLKVTKSCTQHGQEASGELKLNTISEIHYNYL